MKYSFTLFIGLCVSFTLLAQVPQAFNYQGVARDLTGTPLLDQNVGLRISILESSPNGNEVYQEIHLVTTNNLGLFTLHVGGGNVVNGTFTDIDWGDGDYFLQIEIDENGGSNYQLIGTSQLLSVPYALYAGNGSKWKQNEDSLYFEDGNIGIGFASPKRLLHLQGGKSVIQIDRNQSSPAIQFGRYQDNQTFTLENYELGFGIGVDLTGNSSGGYLFIGEDTNKDLSTGIGDGGIRLAIQKGGNIGIGTVNPKSKLQVTNGDIYIEDIEKGVIMKSPNGQCWRYTPDNTGQLIPTAISCPN